MNWRLYFTLLGATILSIIAVLPYAFTLAGDALAQATIPLPLLVLLSILQSSMLFAIVIWLGMLLSKKTGLGFAFLEKFLAGKRLPKILPLVQSSVLLGAGAGILIIVADSVFRALGAEISLAGEPQFWMGLLASFYGGIAEELLLRFFFMALIAWIFMRLLGKSVLDSKIAMWSAIVISTVIFGLGHLPITATITPLTPLVILRALILNGIGGLLFGWLYWKKGLESAMIAHFSADIILHVLLPLLL